MTLLRIEDLRVYFNARGRIVKANDGVDLEIEETEILGLIGETGCGKSILGRAIMGLLSENVEIGGRIIYKGENLLELCEARMRQIRGKEIGMMLQNPSTSLNPVLTVGEQIAEVYRYHEGVGKEEAKKKAADMLKLVGMDPKRMDEYPHQFSGGMKQRVMIAIGLALNPRILIADEPTTGLDSSMKKQILDLMSGLIKSRDVSMLLITHDLEVAKGVCNRIAVMYAGELLEIAPAEKLLSEPKHPYTQDLLDSLPRMGLNPIPGESPSLSSPPAGCRFHPRCRCRSDKCSEKHPDMIGIEAETYVRCFLYKNDKSKG
ncbi:Oligopeptide transport ATP-binding protein OppD [subsurface metagenome]|nr:ATP-binding cassette domain-containing protein [Methanosarcinales archaeon]